MSGQTQGRTSHTPDPGHPAAPSPDCGYRDNPSLQLSAENLHGSPFLQHDIQDAPCEIGPSLVNNLGTVPVGAALLLQRLAVSKPP